MKRMRGDRPRRADFPLPLRLAPTLALFLLLFVACGADKRKPPLPGEPVALQERVSWMGLYHAGRKIGWGRHEMLRLGEADEPADYRMLQEMQMKIAMLGAPQEIRMLVRIDFTENLEPVSYEFSVDGGAAASMKSTGRVENRTLHVRTSTLEGSREREIDLDDVDLFGISELRTAIDGYRVGDVVEGKMFVPEFFDVVPYRVEVVGAEMIRTGAQLDTVYHIRSSMGRIVQNSIVGADGDPIRSDGPMGITMKREDEESARKMDSSNIVDLALSLSVPVERHISEPSRVERIVFIADGVDSPEYESSGFQRVSAEDGAFRVEVDIRNPVRAKLSPAEITRHLASSTYIQSDDPRVIEKAGEILRGAGDPKSKARTLAEWVHRNVRKEMAFTIPSTVDVLATMSGDCNEHAALYAGLARAAGLPTRVAAGLAYLPGSASMYYHAWNEVWVGDHWYPVDPTFGEIPASAVHLRLATGDLTDQFEIARFAGKLRLRIAEIEPEGEKAR